MIGTFVAFPNGFSSLSVLLGKYGLVCLSCLSSPHFFSLFVLLILFFHPAFCSLLFFSLFLQLCSGIQGFSRRTQRLGTARLSDTQCYAELHHSSEDAFNPCLIYWCLIGLYTVCLVKTVSQWCDVQCED